MRKFLSSAALNSDLGLLIVRVGVGLSMLLFHGYAKMAGGPDLWARVGGSMENLGITFLPAMWGFLAAFSEAVCSGLLVLGLLFRPAATLLAFTMLVAMLRHLNLPEGESAAGWKGASHALELFVVYVGLALTGPGRYAIAPGTRGRAT